MHPSISGPAGTQVVFFRFSKAQEANHKDFGEDLLLFLATRFPGSSHYFQEFEVDSRQLVNVGSVTLSAPPLCVDLSRSIY